jgi:Mrp family chromosome partitioning ATPase
MTIQDALERAKELHRARKAGSTPSRERSTTQQDEAPSWKPVPVAEPVAAPDAERPMHFPVLQRLEFDVSICERNKVLLTDQQLAGAGRAAASYRMMRGRILHRAKAAGWSSLGITSPGPGEGKTLTTVNLSMTIAREKQRQVYLLDLDMRNPSVMERVGARAPNALSRYFVEELEPHEVLYQTSLENLVVAGNHEPVAAASEILASPKLDELLHHIRRRSPGAIILIDLPPVLSTDEALVVAPRTDAIFMVVSEGLTRRDGLVKAFDLLSDFTVAGIILNRSSEEVGSDYYGY